MTFRTAATTAVLAVGLAAVGAFAGPEWDPQPLVQHVQPTSASTEIGAPGATDPVGTFPVRTQDVVVHLADTDVTARLREPVGAGTGLPAMVFVHGAGTGDGATAFRETATALASAGVVTLVPSKNLLTYTLRHRDYTQMARDYLRSVDLLRDLPEVDATRVGAYGESEGTWIVPVMARDDPALAFTVMASSPVVRPREQAAYAVDSYLRNTDVPQGVFRAIPRAVGMELPDGGLDYVDFDVRPYLEGMTQPTLVAYGTADASMPVEQGAEEIVAAAHAGGNDDVTVRYYGGADHGIRIDGIIDRTFPRDVASWVLGMPGTATPVHQFAGAQPNQVYLAEPVPSPRWYGNGDVLFGITIGAVSSALGAPLLWGIGVLAWRRGRARRWIGGLARDLRLPMMFAAVGSVMVLVALVVYLFAIARLAVDYSKNPVVVQGGWIGLRALGLATLVPVAIAVNRLSDRRGRRGVLGWLRERLVVDDPDSHSTTPGVRAGQPIARGIGGWVLFGLLTFSIVTLLLTTAYWGVFQLGI